MLEKNAYLRKNITYDKVEQELRSIKAINDSFQKIIITADPIPAHQMENGVFVFNRMDFLTNYENLTL